MLEHNREISFGSNIQLIQMKKVMRLTHQQLTSGSLAMARLWHNYQLDVAVLINSNFKTMIRMPPNQCVIVNWTFLAFVFICPLRLSLGADSHCAWVAQYTGCLACSCVDAFN